MFVGRFEVPGESFRVFVRSFEASGESFEVFVERFEAFGDNAKHLSNVYSSVESDSEGCYLL